VEHEATVAYTRLVLAGAFGSGKSTFASQIVAAKNEKTKIGKFFRYRILVELLIPCSGHEDRDIPR
jgi:nucleoside-triphosphatase THEP1